MKKLKLGVMLLALLLAAIAMVPMVSAESKDTVIQIGEPNLVTDNPSDINETHYQIIAGIQQSNLASTEKTELITTLNEIWSNQSNLSNDEQQKIMIKAASVLLGRTQVISPQWGGTPGETYGVHNDLAKVAGQKMGVLQYYCDLMARNSLVPDSWSLSANHYYITGAADQAENYANIARNYIKNQGDLTTGYTNLAYSLHFMSDLSNPYHYAPVYVFNHQAYESYMNDEWYSDITYSNVITSNYYYYYITDVSTAASNLASYTLQYRSYITNTMDTNSDWQHDATLVQDTKNCLLEGFKYNMGLVDYAKR